MPKPVIINEGDPNCVHVEKLNSNNIGTCIKCGRKVNYDYAEFSDQNHNVLSRNKSDILPYDIGLNERWLNY